MKRSGLKPPTWEQVKAFRRKPRKPLPRVGRRKRDSRADEREMKRQLLERSGGFCEATRQLSDHFGHATAMSVCGTAILHRGVDPHHVWPEDRDRGVHDPSRALLLCRPAHDYAHANPTMAKTLGLLRAKLGPASWGAE